MVPLLNPRLGIVFAVLSTLVKLVQSDQTLHCGNVFDDDNQESIRIYCDHHTSWLSEIGDPRVIAGNSRELVINRLIIYFTKHLGQQIQASVFMLLLQECSLECDRLKQIVSQREAGQILNKYAYIENQLGHIVQLRLTANDNDTDLRFFDQWLHNRFRVSVAHVGDKIGRQARRLTVLRSLGRPADRAMSLSDCRPASLSAPGVQQPLPSARSDVE
jgi:hypothetical protein